MTATDPSPPTVSEIRRRGGVRGTVPFLGPAFVAAIAYVDPGNFATNFSAGASYGFLLLWVIIAANLIAMLIQTLTAKLGMATGRDLPEMCRDTFPRPVSRFMWVQAELVAIATDLAEVIGGAIALNLLFGIPLFTGGLITGVVAFALLALQRRGYRPFELAIAGLLGVILLGFASTVLRIEVPIGSLAAGLVPRFDGTQSLLLATGILGATVMPHVIYLHSALTKGRIPPRDRRGAALPAAPPAGRRRARHGARRPRQRLDADHRRHPVLRLRRARHRHAGGRARRAGRGGRPACGVRVRPCPAGVRVRVLRRGHLRGTGGDAGVHPAQHPPVPAPALTLTPALVVLGIGTDPTQALVLSQVVLSFGIPFALVPLVLLTRRRDLMAELVNRRSTTAAAAVVAVLIIALNGFLIWQTIFGG